MFGATAGSGNPVTIVLDGDGIDPTRMQQIAAWLNVAETTFVLPATHPEADYRVRIFSVTAELRFAGHPMLGICHAWLAAGNASRNQDNVVQECAAGLNAGLAHWLPTVAVQQPPYVARERRLSISREGGEIWVAGATRTLIDGTLHAFAAAEGELLPSRKA